MSETKDKKAITDAIKEKEQIGIDADILVKVVDLLRPIEDQRRTRIIECVAKFYSIYISRD